MVSAKERNMFRFTKRSTCADVLRIVTVWLVVLGCSSVFASPPLPKHGVEGSGGIFSTYSAYLVNPAEEGKVIGLPAVSVIGVYLGNGRNLSAFTITETFWDRLELGYGLDRFDTGDLNDEIERATTLRPSDDAVELHNFNLRLKLLKEGCLGEWSPTVTFGIHYKYNPDIMDINRDLLGTIRSIGIKDNDGLDYTLYASKMLSLCGRPLMLNAGLRSTEAAHIGLLGFTDERRIVAEGSVCFMPLDRVVLAAEYRQKPNEYDRIPGLVEDEDDWWTLCAAYIFNDHLSAAVGYAHFGNVLNHEANRSVGASIKYEF